MTPHNWTEIIIDPNNDDTRSILLSINHYECRRCGAKKWSEVIYNAFGHMPSYSHDVDCDVELAKRVHEL